MPCARAVVGWLRLGIALEHQTRPSPAEWDEPHPQKEATRPAGMNSLQRQARFDDFVQEFNVERPHEAIAMTCPAEV